MPRTPASFALPFVLLMAACNKDEVVWVPFNAEQGQTLVVRVSDECVDPDDPDAVEPGPAMLELESSLSLTDVGVASIDPGCGPVGTNHQVVAIVDDAFEVLVGRVTVDVQTDAVADLDGDSDVDTRGEGEYELAQDSADPGAWSITLQSLGAEGEEREDRFTFRLWQPEALAPELETPE
jgi:hypothetical protein